MESLAPGDRNEHSPETQPSAYEKPFWMQQLLNVLVYKELRQEEVPLWVTGAARAGSSSTHPRHSTVLTWQTVGARPPAVGQHHQMSADRLSSEAVKSSE